MKKLIKTLSTILILSFTALSLQSCGTYNKFQTLDEQIKSAWSEVLSQYKRRADLIPNLVKTVKGYAKHEAKVFKDVTEARSTIGKIEITEDLLSNPENLKKLEAAQSSMGGALSRLLAVAENYPELKADANFRDLQAQLEGTENRITVARGRFIKAIQLFNTHVRSFPANLMAKWFGYSIKENFQVTDEKAVSTPPEVNF